MSQDDADSIRSEQTRLHEGFLRASEVPDEGEKARILEEATALVQVQVSRDWPRLLRCIRKDMQGRKLSADAAEDVLQDAFLKVHPVIKTKLSLPIEDEYGFAKFRVAPYFSKTARNLVVDRSRAVKSDLLSSATVDIESLGTNGDGMREDWDDFLIRSEESNDEYNSLVDSIREIVQESGESFAVAPIALASKLRLEEAVSWTELFDSVSALFSAFDFDPVDSFKRVRRAEQMIKPAHKRSKLNMTVVGQLFDPPISRTAAQKRIDEFWSHLNLFAKLGIHGTSTS